MNEVKKIVILQGILTIIFVSLIWYFVADYTKKHPEMIPTPTLSPSVPPTSSDLSDLIKITSPLSNAMIESPLQISGEARGNWYFEAVFPIRIYDANGNELSHTQGHATSNWMTGDFVPFTATLNFQNPSTDTGTLVFHNDNPSGLAEKDKELDIPVRFTRVQGAINISGQVLLGPTCPAEPATPTPQCAPKQYPTSITISKSITPSVIFKTIQTDSDANFIVTLAPGEYIFNPKGGNPYPRCVSQTIPISEQTRALNIILSCDSGIR